MKNVYLFSALLLANLVVFIWEAASRVRLEDDEPPATRAVPTLQLLSERSQTPSPGTHDDSGLARLPTPDSRALSPADPSTSATNSAKTCLQIGPFDDKTHAVTAERWLSRRRARVWLRSNDPPDAVDFLVYQDVVDRQGSKEALQDLQQHGAEPLDVHSDRDVRPTVVVGKYMSADTARLRVAELAQQGITARVVTNTRNAPVYWIEAASDRGATLIEETHQRFHASAQTEVIDCGKIAFLTTNQ